MQIPYIPNTSNTSNNQNTRRNSLYTASAQSHKHIQYMRRGMLKPVSHTLLEQNGQVEPVEPSEAENTDDSWLNDTRVASPHTSATSHKHVVHYEDLPTVSLLALRDDTHPAFKEQALADIDATQLLPVRKKAQRTGSKPVDAANPHSSQITVNFNEYGPLKALLDNKHVSSITALGPQRIYVELRERCGVNGKTRQMQETPYRFQNEQHMMHVIENLLHIAGRSLPTQLSLSDVRLPDGSLLSVSLPPGAMQGPAFTIRKPRETWNSLDDLLREKVLTQEQANTLRHAIQTRRNICICGPTGSGKTTLLNALCATIAAEERIVTIEEATGEREVNLRHPQAIALLTQQERDSESGATNIVTLRDALSHAYHMRAQRIIVSHCQGDDVPALLRSMFDGGSSIMTTINAQNAQDCLARLELLYLMHYIQGGCATQATPTINSLLRAQIAASLHVIVSLSSDFRVNELVTTPYVQSQQSRA